MPIRTICGSAPDQDMEIFIGLTRGGRVAHPWKVWGEFWKERGREEKGKGEGERGGKGKKR